jgi:non-homologous end joining protein Ku
MEFADKDEIKTAKQASDFPNDTVTISAHPTTEVWHNTYPTGTAYVFIPEGSEANMMLYGLLLDTLSNRDQDVAYVGYGVIRKTEKLVRVQRWRDRIVVQQLAYPDQVNDFPGVPVVPVNRHIEQARTFVYNGIGQFKPEEFTNKTRERLVATIGAEIESWSGDRAARPVDVQDDFMEKLRASFPQD